MPADIIHERRYSFSPPVVWRALTRPDLVSDWLMQTDLQPVEGHAFTFRTDPTPFFDGVVKCKVLVADPPRHLAYSWSGGPGMATRVDWTLQDVSGGTHLRFTHTGFSGIKGRLIAFVLKRGWRRMLDTGLPETMRRAAAGD